VSTVNVSTASHLRYFPDNKVLVIFKAGETTRKLQNRQRLLVEEGGGGSKGTVELVDVAADCVDPSKLLAVVALTRPGIDIEKVCPSLRL
jgi:hypothetical protein